MRYELYTRVRRGKRKENEGGRGKMKEEEGVEE